MEIRTERPEDSAAIQEVHLKAFGGPTEAKLVRLICERKRALISLVALNDGKVGGHILFSPVTITTCPDTFNAVGLAPVAVLPEFQRKGIGSQLIREGLERCKENGYDAVVLLGYPSYYSRFGFSRAADYRLQNEYRAYDEFMVLPLRNGALDRVNGMVKYLPEFEVIGQQIVNRLGGDYDFTDWMTTNQSIFQALRLERIVTMITIGLIVWVAALNIVATLIMMVLEKTRDIAILMSMGATKDNVRRIFILQGVIIGAIGTTLGVVIGQTVSRIADKYHLISLAPDVYSIAYVPFKAAALDSAIIAVLAVLIALWRHSILPPRLRSFSQWKRCDTNDSKFKSRTKPQLRTKPPCV